tara:strand:+ start:980 stop:1159 length:180 start_codon:yes stop_codon:yes gene_type:complete
MYLDEQLERIRQRESKCQMCRIRRPHQYGESIKYSNVLMCFSCLKEIDYEQIILENENN